MRQATRSYRLFVGIDISARTFMVASMHSGQTPSQAQTFSQNRPGFEELQHHLLSLEPNPSAILVVMEATGTYWMQLALHLITAQIAVAVVNPAQAHDFAKARATSAPKLMPSMPSRWLNWRLGCSHNPGHHHLQSAPSCSSVLHIATHL